MAQRAKIKVEIVRTIEVELTDPAVADDVKQSRQAAVDAAMLAKGNMELPVTYRIVSHFVGPAPTGSDLRG